MLTSVWKILRCEPDPGELPASFRREKVAIGRSDVRRGGGARSAAQHELPAHELAVVFAQRARKRMEAGVSEVGARRPLPAVAKELGRTFEGGGGGGKDGSGAVLW